MDENHYINAYGIFKVYITSIPWEWNPWPCLCHS